jgi:hypothetical protein
MGWQGRAFRDFRDRLQRSGKTPKAAIIATARKLLVTLNAMLAARQKYAPPPPAEYSLPANPERFRLRELPGWCRSHNYAIWVIVCATGIPSL